MLPKLRSHVFWRMSCAGLVPAVVALAVIAGLADRFVTRDGTEAARASAEADAKALALLAPNLLAGARKELMPVLARLEARDHRRLTFIALDGTVLADSDGATQVESPFAAPEKLREAAVREAASVVRADTDGASTLYTVSPIRDGDDIVGFVRVALPLTQLEAERAAVRWALFGTALGAAAVALVIAFAFARVVVEPVVNTAAAVEADEIQLEDVPFSLRDCVGEALKRFALRAHQKQIALVAEVSPIVPDDLQGDALRLQQVLVHLTRNAVELTEKGTVVLRLEVDEHFASGLLLRVSVSDTGVGIREEQQREIFEAWTQGDASVTRGFGGTASDLSISARLVRSMGGTISIESEPGRGSTFRFTLPIKPASTPVRARRRTTIASNVVNRRVATGSLS